MFNLLIKTKGRVPHRDSYLARKISGQGLATNYYYQVDSSIVLVALLVRFILFFF